MFLNLFTFVPKYALHFFLTLFIFIMPALENTFNIYAKKETALIFNDCTCNFVKTTEPVMHNRVKHSNIEKRRYIPIF